MDKRERERMKQLSIKLPVELVQAVERVAFERSGAGRWVTISSLVRDAVAAMYGNEQVIDATRTTIRGYPYGCDD